MVAAPKSKSEYVAQKLLDRIVTANFEAGTTIGTEADLLQQYDVSRPTLRESLRILESQGVLDLRPGPKGGIIVRKPGMDILAHGLSVYLRMHEVPFSAVLSARSVIEPGLAAEAAIHATEEDFAKLQGSIDRMQAMTRQDEFIEENRYFHSVIAKASRNHVMEIFWSTISIVAAGDEHGIQYTTNNKKRVIAGHEGILEAMRARDAALAAERMSAHVRDLELLVRKSYKYLLDQATTIVSRQGREAG